MDTHDAAQALKLVRALSDQIHEMTNHLTWLERESDEGPSSRAAAIRLEVARLRGVTLTKRRCSLAAYSAVTSTSTDTDAEVDPYDARLAEATARSRVSSRSLRDHNVSV